MDFFFHSFQGFTEIRADDLLKFQLLQVACKSLLLTLRSTKLRSAAIELYPSHQIQNVFYTFNIANIVKFY